MALAAEEAAEEAAVGAAARAQTTFEELAELAAGRREEHSRCVSRMPMMSPWFSYSTNQFSARRVGP